MSSQDVIHVVGAAIIRDGRCLVTQRPAHRSMPLKWEFPGGKVEAEEDPRRALARELQEELGVEARVGALLGRGCAQHDGRRIELDVYLAEVDDEPRFHEHESHGWFGPDELSALDWPEADLPILPALRRVLQNAAGRRP